MKAAAKVTRAGVWLVCVSLGFTLLVCYLTEDWALEAVDKVRRMTPPSYGLLLFGIWALAYLAGWIGLRARGIHVMEKRSETV